MMIQENDQKHLIQVKDIYKSFGGLHLYQKLSLSFKRGEITALIGPNGCGKSTIFNIITGFLKPDRGEVTFQNKALNRLKPYQINQLGIHRTFQQVRVFGNLTVYENMFLAAKSKEDEKKIESVLKAVDLGKYMDYPSSELSYGQRKLLEFSRVLLSDPEVILLDEPFSGIDFETEQIMSEQIKQRNEKGVTFIIVDHEMRSILDISHRILVLNQGALLTSGSPSEVLENEEVIEVYFGK
jgi:ABC-type branched-subunit amino acid transport system ATPase component